MSVLRPKHYGIESDGGRVRIGPASVLLGRGPECDIVMPDARVSRHHALFRLVEDGVEVIPFGRQPITVNDVACTTPTALRPGDRVACFEHTFVIVETAAAQAVDADVLWCVERSPGALFRVTENPFRVGGGDDDHLIVVGWPATTLLLHRVGNSLVLEATREGVRCGGELAPGECVRLGGGAKVSHAGLSLRVVALPVDPTRVTAGTMTDDAPSVAELRFLPRGGRLTLRCGARESSVYLADRRCDLMAALLQPPPPFAAGELVPDDALLGRVWSTKTQGRSELNTLVFRTRKDLIKADIDGASLLVREAGGVRFCLAPSAQVRVIGV
ncbi:MAG: FHA domain-containing protein [Polyangiales bacterium]